MRTAPLEVKREFESGRSSSRFLLFTCLTFLSFAAFSQAAVVVTLPAKSTGAEIQKALDGLPANGEVRLSAGRYEISQPLLLRHDYETLRGSGPATILHLADEANCPVVVLGPPLTEPKRPITRVALGNLLIDGNRQHQKREFWRTAGDGSEVMNNGVDVWNVTDATVEHVICCRCRSGGLVTARVRCLKVMDFNSYDNQFDGLACYDTQQSDFNGLQLHDNLGAGISLDLDFVHNIITNANLASNDLGIFMRDSRNNSFRKVTISKCHHHGVFMAQTASPTVKGWRLSPGTECIGNIFENLLVLDCGGMAFRVNDAACINNVVSGAKFLRNLLGGLSQPASNPIRYKEAIATR